MKERSTSKNGVARLLQVAGKRRLLLALSAFFALIHALLSLVPYLLIFYIISLITRENLVFQEGLTYLYGAMGAAILAMLFLFLSGILSHVAAFHILYELRRYITDKVGRLPMGYLSNQHSGRLQKILSDDVERMENFIAHQIPDFVKGVTLPLITIMYLFSRDWRLAAISFVPLLILAIWMPRMYSGRNKELIKKYHRSLEEMNAGIIEYLRAMPVMKIFGQSAETFTHYGKKVKDFHHFLMAWIKSSTPPFAVFISFTSNAILPVLALGLYLYLHQGLALSTFILFLILGTGYIRPLFALSNLTMQLSVLNRGMEQIDELLSVAPLNEPKVWQHPAHFRIRFEKVSFAYEHAQWALNEVDVEMKQNEITALVGPSGAGKSTMGQLLARFWDPSEGTIRVGGIDVREYPGKQLMQLISFVFQDSFMFQQSMYENIRMGMDKSREEIEKAAKAAQLHELIMEMPKGYDTLFGQDRTHLSGGEQQRFQLARAILKDAPILILDEATAFADPENEYHIQQAFRHLMKGKTVLIIAHRLSTIVNADQILVFEKGWLVGKGKHKDLLRESPVYQRMWDAHTRAKDFALQGN